MREVWESAAAYESYIGRWSRQLAPLFLSTLAVPRRSTWLDLGCGSGALTSAIVAHSDPARVLALDRSFDFVAQFRSSANHTRAAFVAGDGASLPFDDASIDAAVSGLVLNFIPRPEDAVREMLRCVRPGGVVATYLWDYADGMQAIRLFWDAAIALDPTAADLDEAKRFPLCRPAALEQLFVSAGAANVEVTSITIPTVFKDFDDLWSPFLGGQGPAPAYTVKLPEEKRIALRERFRSLVPIAGDGSVKLSARSWVARGVRR